MVGDPGGSPVRESRKGLGIFRVNVLCQQPMGAAVGKEFIQFFTATTFANSLSLEAVGEDTFANSIAKLLGNNVCIFLFFLSTFLRVLPTITKSQLQNLGMFSVI
jgi:hypothetical protein